MFLRSNVTAELDVN